MTYPTHPEKHEWDALVTPEQSRANANDAESTPEAVILGFGDALYDHLTAARAGHEVDTTSADCYRFTDCTGDVGICGRFGIGAPVAAMVVEELVAAGTRIVCPVGYAGCLDPEIPVGATVVPDHAIRDEGTSYHYLSPGTETRPDDRLVERLHGGLGDATDVYTGPTWTTDAVFRETREEVSRFTDRGVVTVEMEAAAVFAVAHRREVAAAAAFTVSDHLTTDDWSPAFRDARDDLCTLGDRVVRVLDDAVQSGE